MSSQEDRKYPRLRFKGFTDAWIHKTIKSISEYTTSNMTTKHICENGTFPLYDANQMIGLCDGKPLMHDFISVIKDGAGVGRIRILKKNSCILGTMGAILPIFPNSLNFLYYTLERINLKNYIIGTTIPHIYFRDYAQAHIYTPVTVEQVKVGNFLNNFDKYTALTQRKLKALLELNEIFFKNVMIN